MPAALRKYATPLCIAVFVALGLSGSMMFFGVRNHDLVELHEKIGIVFVVIAILHFWRNWKSFSILLRRKETPWLIGIIALAGICMISATLINPGPGHGSPVRGQIMVAQQLAHQPLAKMAGALDMSVAEVALRLKAGGVPVSEDETTLVEVANKSGWKIGQLYLLLIKQAASTQGRGQRHRHGHGK